MESLHDYLEDLNDEYGGSIGFIPPITVDKVQVLEAQMKWELPAIFKYFLLYETNGLIIGNKRIFSLFDRTQKKTFVDNLERNNDFQKSIWFKKRPFIFDDYFVIGSDDNICFCYSKKYNFEDPSIYICENANSSSGVDFDKLDFGLEGLINSMIQSEFG